MKIRELFSGRVFTLSNFLSLLRILLVPFIWYCFSMEKSTGLEKFKYYTLGIFFIILLTDFLDGFLARALNQVSRLGQFIDPLADKLSALILAMLLYHYRDFPLWLILVMAARDLYAVIGGLMLFAKKDIQTRPNVFGKMMVCCMGLAGFIYIYNPGFSYGGITLQYISIFLICIFMVLSSLSYWKTYSRVYFEEKL